MRVVLTEHRGPFEDFLTTARDRLKVRFALHRADAVIAVSSALRAVMQPWAGRRRIDVVANVIDTTIFHHEPRSERDPSQRILLYVGRLNSHVKNVRGLIRALQILNARRPDSYRLRLVGDGNLLGELQQAAADSGLAYSCEFLGFQPKEQVASELARADMLVLPSFAESFSVAAAEALCVGRPVVATRCGGPEELVTADNGVLVPTGDDEALAVGIETVCSDLERYDSRSISESAIRQFGDSTIAERVTAIYERVLAA